ncbi:Gfo/Idh/MocA family oxidoreductase, partial [Priestia megaterium]|uniref:Gfo/Idh/MocA family protein n=1 Tax=Priestia megaterium TaxID=1404 RepID=UPI002FFDE4D3
MTKKKVAIIGAGQVAEKVHISYYRTREEIDLVAAVSPNFERVKAFAERNGIPNYYTNEDDMYITEKPDIVSICTPNKFHYENVIKALENGCDVICEKPPAISAEEASEMKRVAEKNNCLLTYDFHHRFADDVRILKEKVLDGVLGDVYVVKVKALRRCGIPGWGTFTNKEVQGGGPLIDLGIHMLDAALYVMDFPKVESVTAKMFQKIGTKKSYGTLGEWNPDKFGV